jgi:hypothetical protein
MRSIQTRSNLTVTVATVAAHSSNTSRRRQARVWSRRRRPRIEPTKRIHGAEGSKTWTTSSPFKPVMGGGGGRKQRPSCLAPLQRLLVCGEAHGEGSRPWRPPVDPGTAAPIGSRVAPSPAIASPCRRERAEWLVVLVRCRVDRVP